MLLEPPDNARFIEVVRGHLHPDTIADCQAHPTFAHFAGDGRQDEVFIVQFDAEHSPRQNGMDDTFDGDRHFFHKAVRGGQGRAIGDTPKPASNSSRHQAAAPPGTNRRAEKRDSLFPVSRGVALRLCAGLVTVSPTATSVSAPATATGAFFPLTSDVDVQRTATQVLAVQTINGLLGFFR